MNKNQRVRSALCIALVALYIVGLLCMFLNALGAGLALWVISTIGGIAALYHIRNREEKEAFQRSHAEDEDEKPCE